MKNPSKIPVYNEVELNPSFKKQFYKIAYSLKEILENKSKNKK